jgi:hypothetical protein
VVPDPHSSPAHKPEQAHPNKMALTARVPRPHREFHPVAKAREVYNNQDAGVNTGEG